MASISFVTNEMRDDREGQSVCKPAATLTYDRPKFDKPALTRISKLTEPNLAHKSKPHNTVNSVLDKTGTHHGWSRRAALLQKQKARAP
jgi:hypothetical protein